MTECGKCGARLLRAWDDVECWRCGWTPTVTVEDLRAAGLIAINEFVERPRVAGQRRRGPRHQGSAL